ncbi:hypothetical protein H5410_036661 [Solanum commersonii]|uniref:Uncharacterized protein n=1 Tax=Solanum commersonii TaxID=4109 RepID=A0A9J5Y5H4_SOLCO|nr:hypothetical protein H5410_036661 [Solanum commersonii]
MIFKNKEELANSLKITCVKKKFRLKKFPNGKGPSISDMSNQLCIELGCNVSYWKIYKGMEHAKSNVRGTHEHGYNIMTSNIAESVNSMFDVEREFPIISPSIEKYISKYVNAGNKLLAHQIANCKFNVTIHGDVATGHGSALIPIWCRFWKSDL